MYLAIDPVYFWYVFIPTMLISLGVQVYLRSTFGKWSGISNSLGINGAQVGQQLFAHTSLQPIPLQRTPGVMSDHYDPGANVVRLSDPVARQPSVAAMATWILRATWIEDEGEVTERWEVNSATAHEAV